jgi:hypothetical protein
MLPMTASLVIGDGALCAQLPRFEKGPSNHHASHDRMP